jgi:hypothetical protein
VLLAEGIELGFSLVDQFAELAIFGQGQINPPVPLGA